MVDVAVAQFAATEDKEKNLAMLREFAHEASVRGARVVVVPEYAMFTARKLGRRFVDAAEPLDGPFVTGLREIAADRGIHLVSGVIESTAETDRIHNTLVAAGPDGEIAATYRKLHLYDAFGFRESDVVRAGEIGEPETFAVDGVVFGMQTCYDLRFPEVTRRIADAGAHALLLPADWMRGPLKEYHWTTLVRARAIENTLYVAAAGQCAPNGSGCSMIVDPMGVVLAGLGDRVGTATATIDAGRVADVREVNPALALRRFTVRPV